MTGRCGLNRLEAAPRRLEPRVSLIGPQPYGMPRNIPPSIGTNVPVW
jgi:hypothetical protein